MVSGMNAKFGKEDREFVLARIIHVEKKGFMRATP